MPFPTITICGSAEIALTFDFAIFLGIYEISIKRGPGFGEEPPTATSPPN